MILEIILTFFSPEKLDTIILWKSCFVIIHTKADPNSEKGPNIIYHLHWRSTKGDNVLNMSFISLYFMLYVLFNPLAANV